MNSNFVLRVGYLKKDVINLLKLDFKPGEIVLLPGGIKHIRKKRKQFYLGYITKIPEIIDKPDYVGTNPKYSNSIEFIKKINTYVLVAIRPNNKGVLNVVTMFEVTDSKVSKMLKYSRIINMK